MGDVWQRCAAASTVCVSRDGGGVTDDRVIISGRPYVSDICCFIADYEEARVRRTSRLRPSVRDDFAISSLTPSTSQTQLYVLSGHVSSEYIITASLLFRICVRIRNIYCTFTASWTTHVVEAPNEFACVVIPARSLYTPCPEKKRHYIFASNFTKCWPIFKILSPADVALNFYYRCYKISHHTVTSNASLHYLVKY